METPDIRPPGNPAGDPNWERGVLEKLAFATIEEQKAKRRWGIFFKLLGFVYLGAVLAMAAGWGDGDKLMADGRHTALVELRGMIDADGDASSEKIVSALQSAFEDRGTVGVILRINSPGGSPVQSAIIYDEIRRLRAKYPAKPLYAVVEDLCASGGYFVASAADRIYVNKASIIGSIGVLMDGFGFTGTMEKLGVERRLLTAGENKGFLDPFSPQQARQKQHAQLLLNDIHQQFIDAVRQGRGKRLKETPEMFTGLMWIGSRGVEMGLADAFGTVDSVAREVIKVDKVVDYTIHENFAARFARRLGAGASEAAMAAAGLKPSLR